jgi:hypothetical protein
MGKKLSITFIMFQNHHTTRCAPCLLLLHICTRIVPELCPDMHRYEAIKGDLQTCQKRDLMQMMSMKKSPSLFSFVPLIKKPALVTSLTHRIS